MCLVLSDSAALKREGRMACMLMYFGASQWREVGIRARRGHLPSQGGSKVQEHLSGRNILRKDSTAAMSSVNGRCTAPLSCEGYNMERSVVNAPCSCVEDQSKGRTCVPTHNFSEWPSELLLARMLPHLNTQCNVGIVCNVWLAVCAFAVYCYQVSLMRALARCRDLKDTGFRTSVERLKSSQHSARSGLFNLLAADIPHGLAVVLAGWAHRAAFVGSFVEFVLCTGGRM